MDFRNPKRLQHFDKSVLEDIVDVPEPLLGVSWVDLGRLSRAQELSRDHLAANRLRATGYELRATSYELAARGIRATSCKLRAKNCELRATGYGLRAVPRALVPGAGGRGAAIRSGTVL